MFIDRRDCIFVTALSVIFVGGLWFSGWTSPWIGPDTASYLALTPYPEFYFQPRLPFYGWVLALLGTGDSPNAFVVWLQLAFHVAAAAMLYASVRCLGAGGSAATALFLAALVSQGFLIFGRSVAPESLGVSLMLMAMSATLLAAAAPRWKRYVALAAAAGAVACFLRPVMLPSVVLLPVLLVVAARIAGRQVKLLRAVVLLLALVLPLLLYIVERARHTGDFRLVAFGGFQMSGMAGLILSADAAQRFPAPDRELAANVLAARERAEAEGRVLRTPLNSRGERSFLSAAIGYFDIYARTHDDLLYGEILKLRLPGETWTDFDRRLQRFALHTIGLLPESYAAWVVGASARLAGRSIVTNAPFMLASLGLLAMLSLLAFHRPDRIRSLGGSTDTLLVVAIVATYLLIAAPLMVLLTFPASRYIDTAAALLPALPLYGTFRLAEAYFRPGSGSKS